jgi:transglutaminase-like putative cysteine protease
MRYRIRHTTRYNYAEKIHFSEHKFILRPREDHHLRVVQFDLRLMPQGRLRWMRDLHENFMGMATPVGESKQLVILMEAEVEITQENPFDFLLQSHALTMPLTYLPGELAALAPYITTGIESEAMAVRAWLKNNFPEGLTGDTVTAVTRLNTAVHEVLQYTRREEQGIQLPSTTLERRSGSCRDFAVLMIEACRCLGLAARFVSGYLHTTDSGEQSRADNAMHAWVEVYLPGAGWKGLDPTGGVFCTHDFIPVAVALAPETISPIQGSYVSSHHVDNEMDARVEIQKLGS